MTDPSMQPDHCYDARIVRIIDGDTYDVEVDLGFRMVARLPLRLAHVDAPEHNTAAGQRTIRHVTALLGQLPFPVVVHTFKPIDKYGRYLADVYIPAAHFYVTPIPGVTGPVDLGTHLVGLNLAKPYEGGKKT